MASDKVIRLPTAKLSPPPQGSDEENASLLHPALYQISLPRRRTGEQTLTRRSGPCRITLQAGSFFDGDRVLPQPLPFGASPRLLLIHVCGEAVRTQDRNIEVGHSVRGFLRTLGIGCSAREMAAFRKQMLALASTRMLLGVPSEHGPLTINAPAIGAFNAWLASDTAWPGTLEMGERFFEALLEHSVPLAPAAVARLKSSSLALDIYSWLAHRLSDVRQPAGVVLSWADLREQFGHDCADLNGGFKKRFLLALADVLAVYREAKVSQIGGGLRLYASPPPIARRAVVVALPFQREGRCP